MNVSKKEFVEKLGEVLKLAKPNLVKCEYLKGSEMNGLIVEGIPSPNGWYGDDSNEFVIVTCENGYKYKIDITANSLASIAETVFSKMITK